MGIPRWVEEEGEVDGRIRETKRFAGGREARKRTSV